MSTEIYYFSGTGNSLFVARELRKLIPEAEILPIVSLLKADAIKTKSAKVGFVFPCHGLTVPSVVREFLKKADVESSGYFFAIVTRGGSIFRGFPVIDKILKKQHKRLNAKFVMTMGFNDPKLKAFTVPAAEELDEIEKNDRAKLELVKKTVTRMDDYEQPGDGIRITRIGILNFILNRLIPFMVHHVSRKVKKYFYADPRCKGCGTCVKVCPAQKITMENGRPVWQQSVGCYTCYACLNFCPNEAVQIFSKVWMKSYTQEQGRYQHPYAAVKDISLQKEIPE